MVRNGAVNTCYTHGMCNCYKQYNYNTYHKQPMYTLFFIRYTMGNGVSVDVLINYAIGEPRKICLASFVSFLIVLSALCVYWFDRVLDKYFAWASVSVVTGDFSFIRMLLFFFFNVRCFLTKKLRSWSNWFLMNLDFFSQSSLSLLIVAAMLLLFLPSNRALFACNTRQLLEKNNVRFSKALMNNDL